VQPSTVQDIKWAIVELTGLSKDALHVYVGLGVLFAVAAVSRRRLRSIIPLLVVLAVAFAGELLDLRDDLAGTGRWRWRSSLYDVMNTLFWPTIIWLLARFTALFGANGKS